MSKGLEVICNKTQRTFVNESVMLICMPRLTISSNHYTYCSNPVIFFSKILSLDGINLLLYKILIGKKPIIVD